MSTERRNVNPAMRSFVWEPTHGDELSACPDCAHWHALFDYDEATDTLSLREWHEADCSCWSEARD